MMATGVRPERDERGSVLLVSLIFIFIITLLGFALFNLGTVESRLAESSRLGMPASALGPRGART